jgi:uncharacterized protein YgfB (UPF0149 family)
MKSMNETTHYERLTDLVATVEGVMHPAALQGALAGHLCAGQRWSKAQFIMQSAVVLDSKVKPDAAGQQEFLWVYDSTLEALNAEDMSFSPWLPDNSHAMESRLEALTSWVSAFLSGFGTSGQDFSTMDDDAKEILSDLAAIATVDWDEAEEASDDDWYTVVEHARLSAVHLFLAYNEPPKADDTEPTTH